MSQREEKISKLLEFPYDAFLMVRLEYVQILDDELEAKLLRIIEKNVEQERKNLYQKMLNTAGTPPNEKVEITRDIWVPISYRLFMNDLFGTVTSENTVKKALKRMIDKKIIFHRFEPKKQYDAPEYKIHVNVLQMLLTLLKNPGYQTLIPSIFDTLKKRPPQELTPSECQKLIPSTQDASTNPDLRVSKFDTSITEDYGNNITSITEERVASQNFDATAHTFSENDYHFYGTDDQHLIWNCHNWCAGQHGTCEDYVAAIKAGWHETPTGEQAAIQIGAPDGHPKDNHPPADHRATASVRPDEASEQVAIANTPGGAVAPPTAAVRQSYTTPAREASSVPTEALSSHERNDGAATEIGSEPRASDDTLPDVIDVLMHPEKLHASGGKRKGKKVTQAPPELSPEVTRILDDWDSLHKEPVPRTERLIAAAKLLEPTRPTRDELKGCRDWLPTTDRPGKPWYRSHGVKLADIAENITQYRQVLAMSIEPAPLADMKQPKPMDIYTAASLDPERTERNLEKLRQRRLAREAAAQQQGSVN